MRQSALAPALPWDATLDDTRTRTLPDLVGPRILVVDDDDGVLDLVSQTLEGSGFRVGTATTVGEAQDRALDEEYGALVLDVILPDANGLTLYRRLQRLRPLLAPRTVFITGMLDDDEIHRFLRRVGNPLLVKPFDLDELVDTLRRLVATPLV